MATATLRRPARKWPMDHYGAYLTLAQEMEIRRLVLRRRIPLTTAAAIQKLPVPLVRAVVRFAENLDSGEEKTFLWYGERFENPAPRCPECGGLLEISPCRLCRQRQYLARR